ncbi:MAG: leucine-rich repeat domain-containing protein, partial [Anaeroplasmataceae bacterium]|nr:leucine-rich repeat domain-containing protein [Anaeroplasmataceae bacterium]
IPQHTNVYYEGTIEDWCNIIFIASEYYHHGEMNKDSIHFYLRNSNDEWEEVTSIEIPDTITEIGLAQFFNFSNITSIIISESVTSIEYYAFSNCSSLTSITIPDSVTTIDYCTFSNCNSLTDVYYEGRKKDWNNINIDDLGNSDLTAATIYYYSETKPTEEGDYWHYVDGIVTKW